MCSVCCLLLSVVCRAMNVACCLLFDYVLSFVVCRMLFVGCCPLCVGVCLLFGVC